MTVASCPSCKESVTVPVDATPDSVVCCPLCHEEFQLEAFLTQLPPALIVVQAGSGIDQQADAADTAQPDGSSSNVLGAFVAEDDTTDAGDSVPAFDFTPGSVEETEEETTAAAPRRRRQKNPTVEVIKIVAGALLAIPAAQIILWWFVPGDWKRDLLGIGPAMSRVVPWIVPEQFHAIGEDDLANDSPRFDQRNSEQRRRARSRQSTGTAMPKPGSGHAKLKTTNPPKVESNGEETQDNGHPEPGTDAAKVAPKKTPEPKQTVAEETKVLVRGVRGAPQFELADMRAALESAVQASIAWDTDPDQSKEKRQALTSEFYESFAKLSETVTYPPPDDPGTGELVKSINDLIATFAKEPKKLAMIGNQTTEWLDNPSRPNQGVFLFGTVKDIRSSGAIFETELELGAIKQRTITVVSRVDPHSSFRAGDRILMLGALVVKPQHNLLGYEGKEPMVVMGGFPVLLR